MTDKGLNRIAELMKNDIKYIQFSINGGITTIVPFIEIKNNEILCYINIDASEIGEFSDFKLVGKDDTIYSNKMLTFSKGNDEVKIIFEFSITSQEVI